MIIAEVLLATQSGGYTTILVDFNELDNEEHIANKNLLEELFY